MGAAAKRPPNLTNHHYKEHQNYPMSAILVNPVVAMMHNQKLNRWHPVIFREAPLPGPESADKPVRHKSSGHHTEGFEKREDAVMEAQKIARQIVEQDMWSSCSLCLEPDQDAPWDGEGIPADVGFFMPDGDGKVKRVM